MQEQIPGLIAVFLALALAALVLALIFRRDFRDAVLGGPGEASVLGLITVKGVAIVLLCGILVGGILFILQQLPKPPSQPPPETTGASPIAMRLNVHFEPNEVNPRNPQFEAKAFIKKPGGLQPIPIVSQVSEGALSVRLEVPDMESPFFIVFETPKGIWKTDDHSVREAAATARKQEGP
jgi:hypothetical protein